MYEYSVNRYQQYIMSQNVVINVKQSQICMTLIITIMVSVVCFDRIKIWLPIKSNTSLMDVAFSRYIPVSFETLKIT